MDVFVIAYIYMLITVYSIHYAIALTVQYLKFQLPNNNRK